MFTIYANGKVLASSHIREPYVVEDPKVTVEKGKASNFQFSIYANHPMYNEMEKMSTYVDVYLDYGHTDRLEYIFSGRILHTEASEDGKMSVYCEGSYAYLVDSIYPPETIEETPEEHFAKIIESHNSQVGVDKQFVIGETDFGNATEPRQYSGSAYRNSQEAIENDLVDVYGGYVQTRKLGATLYIDYLQDSKQKSSQKITFKQNLLAFQDSITGEDLFTILYPLGADVEVTDEESGEETPEEKLAEEPPTDQETEGGGEEEEPWTPAPVEKVKIGEVNNGSDLLENHELVEKFGRITRVQIFDSADTPEKLLEQAQEYMDRYSFGLLQTLTITAIDLKNFDINVESIKVGDVIGVILPFYSKEIELICSEIEYSLDHPEENQYTIGEPPQDLSAKYDNITTSVTNVSNAMKDNTNAVNRVVQKVGQMGKDIEVNARNITVNANNIQANADQIEINTRNLELKASDADLVWVKDKVTDIETDNSDLHQVQERLMTRMGNVELDINGGEGYVGLKTQYANLYGDWTKFKDEDYKELSKQVDEAGEWIATADVEIKAMEGKISAKVDATYVDDSLTKYDNDVQVQLHALEGKINLKASSDQFNDLSTKYNNVEIELNAVKDTISLKADSSELKGFKDDLSDLETRIGKAEITLNGEEGSIGLVGEFAKLDGDWSEFQGDYSTLKNQVNDIDDRVSDASIKINAMEGTIEAKADVTYVDSTKSTIENNVKLELDAQNALIEAKADNTVVKGLDETVKSVELRMSAAEDDILLRATKEETKKLSDRISVNEGWIDVNSEKIESYVGVTDKLKEDIDGGFIEDQGQRKYKPGLKDKVDLGYTYMGDDGEPVKVPALTERVLTCESDIKQTKTDITLTVRKGDIISTINQSAEAVTINASKINLVGYVTASELEAEFADFKLSFGEELVAINLTAGSITSTNMTASNYMIGTSGVDLAKHYHTFKESSDGTITIEGPSSTPGSFKIADTKTYKDGVSAAAKSVTVTGAWSGGRYTATLSNGYSTSTNIGVNSNELTIKYDSTKHTYNITGPISYYSGSQDVGNTGQSININTDDAAYNAGYATGYSAGSSSGSGSVTLTGSWARGTYTVTASNGQKISTSISSNTNAAGAITYNTTTHKYNLNIPINYSQGTSGSASTGQTVTGSTDDAAYNAGYATGYSAGSSSGIKNVYVQLNGSGGTSFTAQAYSDASFSSPITGASRTGYLYISGEYENAKAYVGRSASSNSVASISLRDFHEKSWTLGHNQTMWGMVQGGSFVPYTASSNEYEARVDVNYVGNGKTEKVLTTSVTFKATEAYNAGKSSVHMQVYAVGDYEAEYQRYPVDITLSNGNKETTRYVYATAAYNAGLEAGGASAATTAAVRLESVGAGMFIAKAYKDSTHSTQIGSTTGQLVIVAPENDLKFSSKVRVTRSGDSAVVAELSLNDFYAKVADVEWSEGHTAGVEDGKSEGRKDVKVRLNHSGSSLTNSFTVQGYYGSTIYSTTTGYLQQDESWSNGSKKARVVDGSNTSHATITIEMPSTATWTHTLSGANTHKFTCKVGGKSYSHEYTI